MEILLAQCVCEIFCVSVVSSSLNCFTTEAQKTDTAHCSLTKAAPIQSSYLAAFSA